MFKFVEPEGFFEWFDRWLISGRSSTHTLTIRVTDEGSQSAIVVIEVAK